MPGATAGKKLDLSKLTDEEAKHVWEVVQRDFDLRKKEEDRLGELKTKIEKEDSKRELLGNQTNLTDSHCIRCLQPFKFLVNSKRQCLDCQLYMCKSCSRYNKKELGWVCDSCRMTRVLKIGTLEWYHENVRARFKRFGSAKVMRSLFKRLSGHDCNPDDIGDLPNEYDTQSNPDVHTDGYEEHCLDGTDSQHYKGTPSSHDIMVMDVGVRESMLAQADMASVFHHILEEQRKGLDINRDLELELGLTPQRDDPAYSDNRTIPSRSISRLSYSSFGSGSAGGPRCSSYLPGPDESDDEDEIRRLYPVYHNHPDHCNHTSPESLNPPPQLNDLNRRMSAIESLLNRIEQKVTPTYGQTIESPLTPNSTSPLPQWEDVDLEEQQLRQKLHEMTGDISDHSLSSDEDEECSRPASKREIPTLRRQIEVKPTRMPSRPASRTSIVVSRFDDKPQQTLKKNYSTESLERKWHPLEDTSKSNFRGSTAALLELGNKVAQAAANVQNAQSEVSFIENRIAALNAAGMPMDKKRKSTIPIQARRLSHHFPTNQGDRFVRNSLYRGSLTQRNPVAKTQTRPTCAKPVMTQGS